MLAAFRSQYVSLDKIEVRDIDKPSITEEEILVKVYATTVNRTDCAVAAGKPFIMRFFTGLLRPKLSVPGTDFAGIIEAVGSKVSNYKIGQRIFGFNDVGLTSQAQYLAVNFNNNIAPIPDGVDFHKAVASLEAAHYAYNFLNKITVSTQGSYLVNGATGAIGSALIQLLKVEGVQVTAVCDGVYAERIKSLGADRIIDYKQVDFTKESSQYDIVFDAVGKSTFSKCKPILKKNGIYLSSELGPNCQNLFLPFSTKFTSSKKVLFPMPTDIKASIKYMSALLTNNQFNPLLDKSYPLEDVSNAYQYVAGGLKIGNVILNIHEA